jgi:hypothetical protein
VDRSPSQPDKEKGVTAVISAAPADSSRHPLKATAGRTMTDHNCNKSTRVTLDNLSSYFNYLLDRQITLQICNLVLVQYDCVWRMDHAG